MKRDKELSEAYTRGARDALGYCLDAFRQAAIEFRADLAFEAAELAIEERSELKGEDRD